MNGKVLEKTGNDRDRIMSLAFGNYYLSTPPPPRIHEERKSGTCRRWRPGARIWYGIVLLVLALFWGGGTALAATVTTVTNDSGGEDPGTLRQLVKDASTETTIDFGSISEIQLEGAASNSTEHLALSITGGDPEDDSNELGTKIPGLLTVNPDKLNDAINELINGLSDLVVRVQIKPGTGTIDYRLLEFTGYNGGISLTGLEFREAKRVLLVPVTAESGNNDTSANASIPYDINMYKEITGGALQITSNAGKLNTVIVANSGIDARIEGGKVEAGNITSPDSDAHADADAELLAYGGGAYLGGSSGNEIKNSLFKENTAKAGGGKVTAGEITGATEYVRASASARVEAIGGGVHYKVSYDSAAQIENSRFQKNTAWAEGMEVTAKGGSSSGSNAYAYAYVYAGAMGGGVYLDTKKDGGGKIENSFFQGNTAKAGEGKVTAGNVDAQGGRADAGGYAYAYGGGMYFDGSDGEIENSLFQGNTAEVEGWEATAGNVITSQGGEAYASVHAQAAGGGMYFNGEIENSLFQGNTAQAKGGKATAGNVTSSTSETYFNADVRAEAHAEAYGGGAYFDGDDNKITNSVFQENIANATGKTAIAGNAAIVGMSSDDAYANASVSAYGGGAYFHGKGSEITGSVFRKNSVRAARETAETFAKGGSGDRTWANADNYAFGGAVYFANGDNVVIDGSQFIDNSITAEAGGKVYQGGAENPTESKSEAKGGAIFINTSGSGKIKKDGGGGGTAAPLMTLKDDAGKIVISGNKIVPGNGADDISSGIHFGRSGNLNENTGYFNDSATETKFEVFAKNEDNGIDLFDPVTVELYNAKTDPDERANFTMTVESGAGMFSWGGKNVFDANGGANVIFRNGSKTVFMNDFTLGATGNIDYRTGSANNAYARETRSDYNTNALKVTLEDGASLAFRSDRDHDTALFDFTDSTSNGVKNSFIVEENVSLSLIVKPGIVEEWYLIATGLHKDDLDSAVINLNLNGNNHDGITRFEGSEKSGIWQVLAIVNSDKVCNDPTDPACQLPLDPCDVDPTDPSCSGVPPPCCTVSRSESDAIIARSGHVLNQAPASLLLSGIVLDAARDHVFEDLEPEGKKGSRLWGRYLGSSDRMDADARDASRGYTQDTNGFLLGFHHALRARPATVGAYFGYTRGETKSRGGLTGKTESDGYHLGLLGKISPSKDDPRFALTGEAGFSRYTNKARHDVAAIGVGGMRAEFDQRIFSFGAGAEYGFESGDTRLTPFARLRHMHLVQDGASELGGRSDSVRARVAGFSGDSFTSEVGARASRTIATRRGSMTPYVSASWRHEYGDTDFSSTARYGIPDGSCVVFGSKVGSTRRDRNAARFGAGVRASFDLAGGRRFGVNADYRTTIGRHNASHALSLLLELDF
ncbi:MAG: autotransporter outer membrane beta-barrel domain-containing protein [Candidatus Accumulibacter sp.]|jgi:hypothetical protein|nr:autotransporter outer membrane beta-barrel domain-containing protein [Accumulibacter sp.]